jgi:protein involved in temperature-dependent protein secretion
VFDEEKVENTVQRITKTVREVTRDKSLRESLFKVLI